MTSIPSEQTSAVGVPPTTNGATSKNGLQLAARRIADAFTSALLNSASSTTSLARSAASDWATMGVAPAPHTASGGHCPDEYEADQNGERNHPQSGCPATRGRRS
jgi:hypothetical protein